MDSYDNDALLLLLDDDLFFIDEQENDDVETIQPEPSKTECRGLHGPVYLCGNRA